MALLDGPLFHTAAGRERWEEPARRNITEEIAALRG
jgi:predicted metal-dependent HD superfamily phosphohydrolase